MLTRVVRAVLRTRRGTPDLSTIGDKEAAVVERICADLDEASVMDDDAKKPKDRDKTPPSELLHTFVCKFMKCARVEPF